MFKKSSAMGWAFCLTVAITIQGFPTHSMAEESAIEEVVVTGTRIQRQDIVSNSPVAVINEAELAYTNTVNVEKLLRDMPQTEPGSTSSVNNGNEGAATIDLRGLGDQRTLVLVDGKRFVPFDSQGQVDVNNIPTALIERIDVVTGGASAVYGSDAMAGVVNFILKKDFEGVEIRSSYQATEEDDGEIADVSIVMGGNFSDERGNAVLHFAYTDREAVSQGDRDFSLFSIASDDGSQSGSSTDTNGNLITNLDWLIPGFESLGPQTFVGFDSDGNPQPRGTRRFNFNPFNLLQVPETRYQTTGYMNYKITDNIEAFGRVHFANTEIRTEIAPSGTFFLGFDVPVDNPFLTPTTRQMLMDPDGDGTVDNPTTANVLIGRRTVEVGPRISNYETTAYQVVGGLRGQFNNGWDWEISGQYGKTELANVFQNDLSSVRVQQSLNAIVDLTGNIICDPAQNPEPGCAPSNFFGDGNLSPEAAAFISLQLNEEKNSDQKVWFANLSGDFGGTSMPWTEQPVGFSIGYEFREETSQSFPDQCYQTPDCSIGFGSTVAVVNEYDVNELFGEILVPVTDRINLEGGYRYADYSTVGSVDSWKAGADWEVLDGLRLRTMFQSAVRAPNIFEFGAPQRPNVGDADTDPCNGTITDPDLQALCIATGAPVGANVPELISGQINITDGGNPDVSEESSDTFTIGFVWQPTFADGLNVMVDFYDIDIDDAIDSFVENDVLNGCYDPALNPSRDPNNQFCQLVRRDPLTGALFGSSENGLLIVAENIATFQTSGVDFRADYSFDLSDGWGSINLGITGTYVDEFEQQASSISPVNSCAGKYGNTCGAPNPDWRFIQRTTWFVNDFTFSYRWRFIDEVEADNPANFLSSFQKIDSYNYFDLYASWAPNQLEGLTLSVGIENLTDEDPPNVGNDAGPTDQNSGNTWPGIYETIGRTYFGSISYRL